MKITRELCELNGMIKCECKVEKYIYRSRSNHLYVEVFFEKGKAFLTFMPDFSGFHCFTNSIDLRDPDVEKFIAALNVLGYTNISSKIKLS